MSLGHYAVLKVAKNASADEIRKSYRRLSQEWHLMHASKANADREGIDAINEAYKALSDPRERERYDAVVAANGGKEPEVKASRRLVAGPGGADSSQGGGLGKVLAGVAGVAVLAAAGWFFMGAESAPGAATSEALPSSTRAAQVEGARVSKSIGALDAEATAEVLAASLAGAQHRETEGAKAREEKAKDETAKEEKAKEEKAKEEKAKEEKFRGEIPAKGPKEINARDERAKADAGPGSRALGVQSVVVARPAATLMASTPTPTPTAPPTPTAVPARVTAPQSSEPRPMMAAAICPGQVAPEMPRTSNLNLTLSEGTGKVKGTVVGGVVKEVQILSGPRDYHATVRSALSRYKCADAPGVATFLQEFHFAPEH